MEPVKIHINIYDLKHQRNIETKYFYVQLYDDRFHLKAFLRSDKRVIEGDDESPFVRRTEYFDELRLKKNFSGYSISFEGVDEWSTYVVEVMFAGSSDVRLQFTTKEEAQQFCDTVFNWATA